jgi:hypothetical protein
MAFLGYSSSATGLLQPPSVIYLQRGGGATWSFRKGATAQAITLKARLNQAGSSWSPKNEESSARLHADLISAQASSVVRFERNMANIG